MAVVVVKEGDIMKLQNEQYDKLKLVAWILAPLITFIGAICTIWGVPNAEKITATLAALDTFLGTLLTVSNRNYYKDIDNENSEVE